MRARGSNKWYARYVVQIPVVFFCPGAAAFAQRGWVSESDEYFCSRFHVRKIDL